ncbi:hypothetical protein DYI21_17285 [Thalassospira tepidiphila]|nr:hypothetical protein [Thalassospira tepidiphila]
MVAGCTSNLCNSIRTLQWEALTAGLLGLAGGFSVIVSTRKQILHSERVAQQQRRDFLVADFNKELINIEKICLASIAFKNRALKLSDPNEPEEVSTAIIESLFSEDPDYDINGVIELGQSLQSNKLIPLSMRDPFETVLSSITDIWLAIQKAEFQEIPMLAEKLEVGINQMKTELTSYRQHVLSLRLF